MSIQLCLVNFDCEMHSLIHINIDEDEDESRAFWKELNTFDANMDHNIQNYITLNKLLMPPPHCTEPFSEHHNMIVRKNLQKANLVSEIEKKIDPESECCSSHESNIDIVSGLPLDVIFISLFELFEFIPLILLLLLLFIPFIDDITLILPFCIIV